MKTVQLLIKSLFSFILFKKRRSHAVLNVQASYQHVAICSYARTIPMQIYQWHILARTKKKMHRWIN